MTDVVPAAVPAVRRVVVSFAAGGERVFVNAGDVFYEGGFVVVRDATGITWAVPAALIEWVSDDPAWVEPTPPSAQVALTAVDPVPVPVRHLGRLEAAR